jgi:hypothetical protein
MQQYQTKRQKITRWLKGSIETLKASKKESAIREALVANCALDLGVREEDVYDVLSTFERAMLIEVKGDRILL